MVTYIEMYAINSMAMNLKQLEYPLDPGFAEDLSSSIEEESLSISWYEAEPEKWMFSAIFREEQQSLLIEKFLRFFREKNLPIPRLTSTILSDKDWVAAVYRDLPSLKIGKFYIYGSHIQDPPPTDCIPLNIEAATAFGSGQHESTEGCLKALEYLSSQPPPLFPLDMGCGSGILAIAMAILWKTPVVACDNDPEAVRVTIENSQKNRVESLIQGIVSEGFGSLHNKTFDLITANILAGPLCQMAEDVTSALKPGGFIVLSGLLTWQAEEVIKVYRKEGLYLFHQIFVGEWSTLILRKDTHE